MDEYTRELEIQRVVDGRMVQADLALFVEFFDEHPEHWREVALAFMEDQSIRNAIRDEPTAPTPSPRRSRSRLIPSLVIAVTMVCCVMVGRWTVSPNHTAPAGNVAVDPAPSQVVVVVLPESLEPPSNPARSFRAPLVADESRSVFNRHGFRVSEEELLYVLEDSRGRHFTVPRRRVTFVSD